MQFIEALENVTNLRFYATFCVFISIVVSQNADLLTQRLDNLEAEVENCRKNMSNTIRQFAVIANNQSFDESLGGLISNTVAKANFIKIVENRDCSGIYNGSLNRMYKVLNSQWDCVKEKLTTKYLAKEITEYKKLVSDMDNSTTEITKCKEIATAFCVERVENGIKMIKNAVPLFIARVLHAFVENYNIAVSDCTGDRNLILRTLEELKKVVTCIQTSTYMQLTEN